MSEVSILKKNKVPFVFIANPLTPAESRNLVHKKYNPKRSLAKYLGPLQGEWAVSVSGRMVHRSEWSKTYLNADDCVVVAPIMLGGGDGGGKQIMRIVALVALAIFAPWLATSYFGLAGAAATAVTVGVTVAGTLLINALLPPPTPEMPNNSMGNSVSYGIDGPKNQSTVDIPVQVVYGEAWQAGNYLQLYTENDGDDQYLNALINLGEGPIEGIEDIHINGQPIENYSEVQVFKRFGDRDQDVIPYFSDIVRPVNKGAALKKTVYTYHTLTDPVDRVRIDITLPRGLHRLDDEDGIKPFGTAFIAEIQEEGTEGWLPLLPDLVTEQLNGTTLITEQRTISIYKKSTAPLRRSYYSRDLDKSKRYTMRFTHTQEDERDDVSNSITLTDVNEILLDDISYRYTALLGLRIKMNDQLNGIPTVLSRVKGRKVKVWDALTGDFKEEWSDNPAWIALDALTNSRYGGKMKMSRIQLSYFRQWAAFCVENNLKFNGVIDQKTNVWDALLPIFKVGRAYPVRSGTRMQVATIGIKRPVQLFSVGNIKKGSMGIDWMDAEDRANEVHVSYFDRDDLGKKKTVIVDDKKARERGDEQRISEMTMYGVDNVEQATREGTLALNVNRLLKTVSFEAPLEAIACTIGDVIALQHDMPDWGFGGLLAPGSTNTLLKLDRSVPVNPGQQFVAMVRHDTVVQWMGEAESILGNTVFPSFGFNVENFDRFRRLRHVSTGRDFRIEEPIIDSYGRHGLILDGATGIMPGDTIQLVDTDVIETRDVLVEAEGDVFDLHLASPLSSAPREETVWAFGLKNTSIQNFTVINISGTDDLWRKISAIEYSDEAYSDAVIGYKPTPPISNNVLGNVAFNGFNERRYLEGAVYRSEVSFSWQHTSGEYLYSEVHVSIDDSSWELRGANASAFSVTVPQGTIRVKLVPVDIRGNKPSLASVTTHEYVVASGAPNAPAPPSSVTAEAGANLIEIKWGNIDEWAANKNLYRYEVWGAEGQSQDFSVASLLAITGNNHYPHVSLKANTWYTYWVRAVNILSNDMVSDFAPSAAGISVKTAEPDPIELIDLIPDGIKETDLGEDVLDRFSNLENEWQDTFENVETVSQVVSRLTADIQTANDIAKTEVFERKEAFNNLEAYVNQQIGTLVDADEAAAVLITELEARVGDEIQSSVYDEAQVRATADSALAQQISALQAQVGEDIQAQIAQEQIARADADSALTTQLNALSAKVTDDIEASIAQEQIARADADSALTAQINQLSAKVTDDVEAAILQEQSARADADSALTSQLNTLTSRVDDAESSITSEATTRANADSALSTQLNTLTSRVDDAESSITSEATTRANADSALSTQLSALTTRVGTAESSITSEATTRANADSALTTQLNALTTRVGAAESSITSEATTRANADAAMATDITELVSRVDDADAAITSEATTRANADTALTNQLNTLTTRVGTAESAITTEQTTRANADTALTNQLNALTSRVGSAESAITTEQTTRANADTALSNQLSTLVSRVEDAESAITSEQTARANGDSAITSSVNTLTTRVGNAETSITQAATSIDGLKAQYAVKINTNGHIVGFDLLSTPATGSGSTSAFNIVADKFNVIKPGATTVVPVFTVDANSGNVVLRNAVVGDIQSDNYVAGVSGWCIKK